MTSDHYRHEQVARWADEDRRAHQHRCCEYPYEFPSAPKTKTHVTNMLAHQLRNVITQAPNNARVKIVTATPAGAPVNPRALINAEYGYVPEEHLTLVVEAEPVATAAPSTPAPLAPAVRQITTHKVNPVNDVIILEVMDGPGSGGAAHCYRISGIPGKEPVYINFQNGPIALAGINGLTQEVLLAIVIDRLECFQAGPFACKDNEDALAMIKGGLTCLQKRTRLRMAQQVEGTHSQHSEALLAPTAINLTAADVQTPIPVSADKQVYFWNVKGGDVTYGGFDSIAECVADAKSIIEKGKLEAIEVLDSRPATAEDRSLFEGSEDEPDFTDVNWFEGIRVQDNLVHEEIVTGEDDSAVEAEAQQEAKEAPAASAESVTEQPAAFTRPPGE